MGKINSKDKGKRFERQLANILKARGYEARRTAQFCGNTGEAADVIGLPGIHIEAKHQETMRLYDWMHQAERDAAGGGNIPMVIHKKNNEETLATMRLDDFLDLYERRN